MPRFLFNTNLLFLWNR